MWKWASTMTTPTPTSSPSGLPTEGTDGLAGLALLGVSPGATPNGIPDALELQRFASATFRALPGADVPVPVAAAPAGSPLTPGAANVAGAPLPSAPAASETPQGPRAPYGARHEAPYLDIAPAPAAKPSYYFLDHAGPSVAGATAPADPGSLDTLARQGLRDGKPDDRVTPLPFSLPGQDSLNALGLAEASRAPEGNAALSDPRVLGVPLGGYPAAGLFDVQAIRRDFPILAERVNGKPLVWFDNAATTQKPRAVIDRISRFYEHENSNIHRAAHELAARATDAYESARRKVADFLGAAGPEEIVFVRGATEGINLLAATFGEQEIGEGDEIVVSHLEHHANIVPWQRLAERKRAKLRVIPVDDDGQILLADYAKLLNPRTKLVAVTQVSNALGTVTPVTEIIALAHAAGAKTLVDGAQAVSHMRVNVQAMDADFYVFSGHKVFGPTGIGVVYGKKALLDRLPPYQGGGNMIADVTFERIQYQPAPALFEAGTGNIADAVGLGAAIDYVGQIGLERIQQYEHQLLEYATARLGIIPGVRLIGTAPDKASVLSFVLEGYKTEEVGHALNKEGVAVRSGHHCAQPILRRFGVEATVRPSLAFYNTCEEVDTFIKVIRGLAGRRI